MRFKLVGENEPDVLEAFVSSEDGDINLYINDVLVLYVSSYNGQVHRMHLDEDERVAIPGVSLDNGRISIAQGY
jgi:hypothetical protein